MTLLTLSLISPILDGTVSLMTRTRPYPTLKRWRDAQGINQRDAARLLGITQSEYSKFETGRRTPRPKRAGEIMDKTGVPLEALMGIA
jgi:transcriptional regulator with XRE-family HTH domain